MRYVLLIGDGYHCRPQPTTPQAHAAYAHTKKRASEKKIRVTIGDFNSIARRYPAAPRPDCYTNWGCIIYLRVNIIKKPYFGEKSFCAYGWLRGSHSYKGRVARQFGMGRSSLVGKLDLVISLCTVKFKISCMRGRYEYGTAAAGYGLANIPMIIHLGRFVEVRGGVWS